MRTKLYHFLVNRHAGICARYHKFHDGRRGMQKFLSWFYLFWLNFCYYFLFCRFLGKAPEIDFYEQKKPPVFESESALAAKNQKNAKETAQFLKNYDVISFDIFDTLIFRPFSEPADVFFFVGERLGFFDFKRLRMEAEAEARMECFQKKGHTEVTLEQIWSRLSEKTGIDAQRGMAVEQEMELAFCYANPFMKEVFLNLLERKKTIIITSDMYLPETFLKKLLEKNGYGKFEHLFVSCEYGKNKAAGDLYELVKQSLPNGVSVIHVGDNPVSDIKNAKRHGVDTFYYPNVNRNCILYRPYDMSVVIGGAYRGLVNNKLYSGMEVFSMEYEYGYVYGGLFVLGYCNFIHEYAIHNDIDKVLFLARDGDILQKAYAVLFPEEKTDYVYWSRAAATKLMARYNRYDFFRRYVFHKADGKFTLEEIFGSMELQFLLEKLPVSLQKTELLTNQNAQRVKTFLEENWESVLAVYEKQSKGAEIYYKKILGNSRRVLAVDIGWAGSGAVSLDYLVQNVWHIPCEIIGAVAGTNTVHNAEPDASEMFLQTKKLVSYLYSQSFNRDLWKKHNPNLDYNIFFELLLSSPTRQFKGFSFDEHSQEVTYQFGNFDANEHGIREIGRGILDFVSDYKCRFEMFPFLFEISGRDAYAPILAASGNEEAYLKHIKKKFEFEPNVV